MEIYICGREAFGNEEDAIYAAVESNMDYLYRDAKRWYDKGGTDLFYDSITKEFDDRILVNSILILNMDGDYITLEHRSSIDKITLK